MKWNHLQIDQFVFLAVKIVEMPNKQEERIASALKSLSSNGLTLPTVDRHNYEALIG